jgi:hypothetical protein
MLTITSNGQASIVTDDGVLHQVAYEPLDERAMILQAKYHLWIRKHDYRRQFVCMRCKEAMESQTTANEEEGTWELLTVCACRALYGTIPLSTLHSLIATLDS